MTTITRNQARTNTQTSAASPGSGTTPAGMAASPAYPAMMAPPAPAYPCPIQSNPIQPGPPIPPNTAYDGSQDPDAGSQTTMRDLLREHIGDYVVCEHLVGTKGLVTKEGRLQRVGANAFVLEDPRTGDLTNCDYFSLKFFHVLNDELYKHK